MSTTKPPTHHCIHLQNWVSLWNPRNSRHIHDISFHYWTHFQPEFCQFISTSEWTKSASTHETKHKSNVPTNWSQINTIQQYQPISYQRPKNSSIPYLKEDCIVCGLNRKYVRELLMQHDGKLENCPFKVPLFIKKTSAREQLPQNNHKNGSQPKDFNIKSDTSNTAPPWATIY